MVPVLKSLDKSNIHKPFSLFSISKFVFKISLIMFFCNNLSYMISYLSENEAKDLQNGDVHHAPIPDFGMGYLENHLVN